MFTDLEGIHNTALLLFMISTTVLFFRSLVFFGRRVMMKMNNPMQYRIEIQKRIKYSLKIHGVISFILLLVVIFMGLYLWLIS